MSRLCLVFKIKPELKNKFIEDLDNIWPELVRAIKKVGLRNYSLFYKKDGTIIAYMESDDPIKSLDELGKRDIRTKWEKHVEKYFVEKDETSLGPVSEILEEIYHLV